MDGSLEIGRTIPTKMGKTLTVKKYLAEGGQGEVYIVDYGGEDKALKWYKPSALGKKPQVFYDNINGNVMRGAPSKEFLWPLDITEWSDNTFGYVMDLRPEGYHEVTEFMLTHVRFKSYKTIIDAALKIVSAFRILHNNGYSYYDMNDGNFFINPDTGDVLICDNDNVLPENSKDTNILGKPRYMAPEIVRNEKTPNSLTDRFSMSVILFLLFCNSHPLEGKRYLVPALSPELQEKLYGTDPIFIMDPDNDANGPHPQVHKNVLNVWGYLPEYVKNIFLDAFSHKTLVEKPNQRPTEIDWLKVLTRFRSEIVLCECGNEIFTENGESCSCDGCGKKIIIPFRLELRDYSIPAVKGSRIYRCQVDVCKADTALDPIAQIVENKNTGALGVRNKTEKSWEATNSKGEPKKVGSGEVIPLKDGISFTVSSGQVTIKENNT